MHVQHQQQAVLELVHTLDHLLLFGRHVLAARARRPPAKPRAHPRCRRPVGSPAPSSVRATTFMGNWSAGRSLIPRPPAQVDRRYNLSAQIDESAHHLRHQRDVRHFLVADHFLHLLHRHSEKMAFQKERAELLAYWPCQLSLLRARLEKLRIDRPHHALPHRASPSPAAAPRPSRARPPAARAIRPPGFLHDVENVIDYQARRCARARCRPPPGAVSGRRRSSPRSARARRPVR